MVIPHKARQLNESEKEMEGGDVIPDELSVICPFLTLTHPPKLHQLLPPWLSCCESAQQSRFRVSALKRVSRIESQQQQRYPRQRPRQLPRRRYHPHCAPFLYLAQLRLWIKVSMTFGQPDHSENVHRRQTT